MIKFVDFKIVLGEKKISNKTIENEAGWVKGQVKLKTGINQRFVSSNSSENLAYKAIEKIKTNTKTLFADSSLSPKIDEKQNIVIKVRTESFDNKSV